MLLYDRLAKMNAGRQNISWLWYVVNSQGRSDGGRVAGATSQNMYFKSAKDPHFGQIVLSSHFGCRQLRIYNKQMQYRYCSNV